MSIFAALDVFCGECTSQAAHVYVRFQPPPGTCRDDWSLDGFVQGPECVYARTLPAKYPLRDAGPGESVLLRALLPDPCPWTLDFPGLYRVRVELRGPHASREVWQRPIGLRSLGVRGRSFRWNAKRWVLRGVDHALTNEHDLSLWRELAATLVVTNPPSELCDQASRLGVLIAARLPGQDDLPSRLKQLARWPAVGVVLLDGVSAEVLGAAAANYPNLLLAEPLTASASPQSASVRWGVVDGTETNWQGPVIAIANEVANEGVQRPLDELRAGCDRLQRDLAPRGDFAGYVVMTGEVTR